MKRAALPILVAIMSLAAAQICGTLLRKHVTGVSGAKWFDAGCRADAVPGSSDCAKVLASPYSYFPPKPSAGEKPDRTPRVPVAFLGLLYYSALAVWMVGVGTPSRERRRLHLLPLAFVTLGLLSSGYYTYIMFTVLTDWCAWCLTTHVLNVMIAVCLLLMFPRSPRGAARHPESTDPVSDSSIEPSSPAPLSARGAAAVPHPSRRLVIATLLAIGCINYAHFSRLGLITWKKRADTYFAVLAQYKEALDRIRGDSAKLVRNWQLADHHDIVLRGDDAFRSHAQAGQLTWTVVVFSDFACPSCKRVTKLLEEEVQPLFAGRLKIVFRHFPLNSDCNGKAATKLHPYACVGAAIAEAARLHGGPDAFLEAHDFLFANQDLLKQGRLDPEQVALHLGFDPPTFVQSMKSKLAAKRIWEDVNAGAAYGVASTPSVFVQGRRVDTLAVTEIGFWDELANRFWKSTGSPRPPETQRDGETPKQRVGRTETHDVETNDTEAQGTEAAP